MTDDPKRSSGEGAKLAEDINHALGDGDEKKKTAPAEDPELAIDPTDPIQMAMNAALKAIDKHEGVDKPKAQETLPKPRESKPPEAEVVEVEEAEVVEEEVEVIETAEIVAEAEPEEQPGEGGGNGAPAKEGITPIEQTPEEQLEEARKIADDYYKRLLRTAADFENFKKRAANDRQALLKYGHEKLVQGLLPSLDNFERALHHVTPEEKETALAKGVEMIFQQFIQVLQKFNVKSVSGLGQKFDPTFMEAVEVRPTDAAEPGQVIAEHHRGYFLGEKLIRAAMVVVAGEVQAKEEETEVIEEAEIVEAEEVMEAGGDIVEEAEVVEEKKEEEEDIFDQVAIVIEDETEENQEPE